MPQRPATPNTGKPETGQLEAKLLGDKPLLRIVTDGPLGHDTRLYIGDLEVTRELRVTGATIRLNVDGMNMVSLECISYGTEITAELDDLMIRHVGRRRFGVPLWRLRKWWWGVRRQPVRPIAAFKPVRKEDLD